MPQSRHKAMMALQKGGDVKQGKSTKQDLLSVIDSLESDSSDAWNKYIKGGRNWLQYYATPEEASYVDSVRNSLLENLYSEPDSIPKLQDGGYISGLRGLLGRASRERRENVAFQKKLNKIKKKSRKSGFWGGVGKFAGQVMDKVTDVAVAAIPGVGPGLLKAKDYLLDPLIVGSTAKLGADLGYGKRVKIDDSNPWLKSAKGELKDYQKDIRGSFSDTGISAGIGQFGKQAFGDITKEIKSFKQSRDAVKELSQPKELLKPNRVPFGSDYEFINPLAQRGSGLLDTSKGLSNKGFNFLEPSSVPRINEADNVIGDSLLNRTNVPGVSPQDANYDNFNPDEFLLNLYAPNWRNS